MAISVLVLYPKTADSKFDMKYYLDSHMPLVAKEFKPFGFKGYRVISLKSNVDESPAAFSTQCQLEFDSVDNLRKALQEKGGVVLGDVPNFSNVQPQLIVGDEETNITSS